MLSETGARWRGVKKRNSSCLCLCKGGKEREREWVMRMARDNKTDCTTRHNWTLLFLSSCCVRSLPKKEERTEGLKEERFWRSGRVMSVIQPHSPTFHSFFLTRPASQTFFSSTLKDEGWQTVTEKDDHLSVRSYKKSFFRRLFIKVGIIGGCWYKMEVRREEIK